MENNLPRLPTPDRLEPAQDASFDDEFGIESPVVNGGGALKPRPLQNGDLDSDEPIMTNGHGKAKKPSMFTLKTLYIKNPLIFLLIFLPSQIPTYKFPNICTALFQGVDWTVSE